MNPMLSITIDKKNRAISVASGMITVGAKIDVSISGLPDGIPNWELSDRFTGPSIRFRLVDEQGRDLARYPLADSDSWSEFDASYYTTNPVEFDTALLRGAFDGVAFNDWLELGLIIDSAVDDAQYAVGRVKVRQWAVAQTEDPTVLPDWRDTLAKLNEDLASVAADKAAAEAAREAAAASASSAAASVSAANANATAASVSASAAASSAAAAASNAAAAGTSAATSASSASAAKSAQAAAEAALEDVRDIVSGFSGFADVANPKASLSSLKTCVTKILSILKGIGA